MAAGVSDCLEVSVQGLIEHIYREFLIVDGTFS